MRAYPKIGSELWIVTAKKGRPLLPVKVRVQEVDWTTGKVNCVQRTGLGTQYFQRSPEHCYQDREGAQELINRLTGFEKALLGTQLKLEV